MLFYDFYTMREIVIGDIHSGFKALEHLIGQIRPTPKDLLIFLGDYVDGWSEPTQTIAYLMSLSQQYSCIFLKGNHDALTMEWLIHGEAQELWLEHGGATTVAAYKEVSFQKKEAHLKFLKNLRPYYTDAKNRLFVHAGFTNQKGVSHEYFEKLLYWDRTLWETALSLDPTIERESPFYPKRFKIYQEVFIGHSALNKIGVTKPLKRANIWNIDTAAAFKGPLSAMEINTYKVWQTPPVYSFYPKEKGRN